MKWFILYESVHIVSFLNDLNSSDLVFNNLAFDLTGIIMQISVATPTARNQTGKHVGKLEIDQQLMQEALQVADSADQKFIIEEGLKLLVQRYRQQEIRKLRGKLQWDGELDEMRQAHAI